MVGGTPIEFLQTDTAINTGNSGGPMFNTSGEVIGIVSFILTKSGGFDGIGFATSANTARQALLTSSGVLAGFEGIMLDPQKRVNANSMVASAGLIAGTVPAEIGGRKLLLGGDLIIEINGLICEGPHDFALATAGHGDPENHEPLALTVFRNGETRELIAGPDRHGVLELIQDYAPKDESAQQQ